MKNITEIQGKTIPLAMNDVDTDLIIPAQYLTSVSEHGYGENLFRRLKDNDADFVFNQEKYQGANILLAGNNFGCGSSREHAVWALRQAGVDAVIAPSFADIFTNNSGKNGLLLICLPEKTVDEMMIKSEAGDYDLTIDLNLQEITTSEQDKLQFELDPFVKHCFMQGLDELDYLLSYQAQIAAYKKAQEDNYFVKIAS